MKYKTHVCFNYQNWLIESVFISHVTQKSDEKWNMRQFEQMLLCQQNLSAVMLLRCGGEEQLARISYLLAAADISRRARRYCLLEKKSKIGQERSSMQQADHQCHHPTLFFFFIKRDLISVLSNC